MAFLYPGCLSRYTTFITRPHEKSFVSYATFIARQPLDDLLWFYVAYQCDFIGKDNTSQWSTGQFGFRFAFIVLLVVDLLSVLLLRLTVTSRSGPGSKKAMLSVALSTLCAVSSGLFFCLFIYRVCWLYNEYPQRHEQWNMIILLALLKGMRTCVFGVFALYSIRAHPQRESVKDHLAFGRHNTLPCLEARGLLPKMSSLAFVSVWLGVWILYQDPQGVLGGILWNCMLFGSVAVIALVYYALRLDDLVGPCIWNFCLHTWGWGPWCVFECKKGFACLSDLCCQGETEELHIQRRDDNSSDVIIPDSLISKSGSWMNTSWGVSLRRSLEHSIQRDLQNGCYADEIAKDDPQAPLYFLSGQPAGFDLAKEKEVWTSHASNTFWSTALAYVDELKCCSQKIKLTNQTNPDENVIGLIFLLKVADPTFYLEDNGGGIYHYDGADCPLCTSCLCCQLNRGKLFARHNYCFTEYCGDDAPTGMADAFIFRFGAKEKAGLEIAHVYRIIRPSAKPSDNNRLLSQPVQNTMDNV